MKNWRLFQRVFELLAVGAMMAGVILMWMRRDPDHTLIYGGFFLLAIGKLIETLNIPDTHFRIVKLSACISILILVVLNLTYHIRSIVYILIPLGIYYVLHYVWVFQQQRKS